MRRNVWISTVCLVGLTALTAIIDGCVDDGVGAAPEGLFTTPSHDDGGNSSASSETTPTNTAPTSSTPTPDAGPPDTGTPPKKDSGTPPPKDSGADTGSTPTDSGSDAGEVADAADDGG